jgi:hypothetical protein
MYSYNTIFLFTSSRGLSDTDSDGKMNINEFSIACKLINLKLRDFEVPCSLPPSLIRSLQSFTAGTFSFILSIFILSTKNFFKKKNSTF